MKITYVVGEMFSNCDQIDNFVCFKNWHQSLSEQSLEDIIFLPGQGLTPGRDHERFLSKFRRFDL